MPSLKQLFAAVCLVFLVVNIYTDPTGVAGWVRALAMVLATFVTSVFTMFSALAH